MSTPPNQEPQERPLYPEPTHGPLGTQPAQYAQKRTFAGPRYGNTQRSIIVLGIVLAIVVTAAVVFLATGNEGFEFLTNR